MSSYQKLREENEQLKERLIEVCLRPTSERTAIIIAAVKVAEHLITNKMVPENY
jgi:hypothetical protein